MTSMLSGMSRRPLRGRSRTDFGKVLMCTVCAPLALGYTARAIIDVVGASRDWHGALTSTLIALYYIVVVSAYLRRGSAVATSPVWSVRLAAVFATWLPLVAPLLGTQPHHGTAEWTGDTLLLAGVCWSIWSLLVLGRNLSIIPQARALATSGPYRIVAHPLYFGELTMLSGLLIVSFDGAIFLLWAALVRLQLYRIHHEEALLTKTFPQYARYRATVKRLVPGIY